MCKKIYLSQVQKFRIITHVPQFIIILLVAFKIGKYKTLPALIKTGLRVWKAEHDNKGPLLPELPESLEFLELRWRVHLIL